MPDSLRFANGTLRDVASRVRFESAFDVIVVAIFVVAPQFMGGRHPWGRLVYVALVAALAAAWVGTVWWRKEWRYRACGVEGVILWTAGLLLLQCAPLPMDWITTVSPRTAHYLPLWNSGGSTAGWGAWSTLSLTPLASRQGLGIWLAHATLLVLLLQRLAQPQDVIRLIRWIAVAGIVLAVIALLQYLFSNGRFLWIYQDPYRDTKDVVRGPFYNENHCAHFLVLALVPAWSWLRAHHRVRGSGTTPFTLHADHRHELITIVLGTGLALIVLAILLSRSRGGLLAAVVAITIGCRGLFHGSRSGSARRHLLLLAGVGVGIALALTIHGHQQVSAEVGSLASTSLDELDQRAGRRNIWFAAQRIGREFPWCGAGVGSFRDVFPTFYPKPRQYEYSYAESGYLQIAAETGVAGLTLLALAGWCLARRLAPLRHASPTQRDWEWIVACLSGLTVSLLHSLVDFVWFIPACLSLTIGLLAAAIRWADFQQNRDADLDHKVSTRWTAPLIALVGAVVFASTVRDLWGPARAALAWNRYELAMRQEEDENPDRTTPADPQQLEVWQKQLREVVEHDPGHVRAHLQLATVQLQLFEVLQSESDNPMSLVQIRDAALASQFVTRTEQDAWLTLVVGPRRQLLDDALRHSWHALRASPLQGIAYLNLAELMFLRSPLPEWHPALIQQAMRVRPYAATVLFAAGREAVLAGDLVDAMQLWRQAYHQDARLRRSITQQLGPMLPAELFLQEFQPNRTDLFELYEFYQSAALPAHTRIAGRAYLQRLTATAQDPRLEPRDWQRGYSVAATLADPRALALARRAVESDPGNDLMRRRLGMELLARGQNGEAAEQLERCLRRNPADRALARKLELARSQSERIEGTR